MLKVSGPEAYQQLITNVRKKIVRVPTKNDKNYSDDGGIYPEIFPKNQISSNETIFTIGSCFARNIEGLLLRHGMNVPVASFKIPNEELPHAGPHLLNEYNAGTIVQRLESVVGDFAYDPEMGIESVGDKYTDLFLHISSAPVTRERLIERRKEIGNLYKVITKSDLVIITLGLVECWYDTEFKCYVNKAPSRDLVKSMPGRFEFHRLDVDDVVTRMSRALEILRDMGTKNVLLTVSPIPLEATFMTDGAVVANSYSKAVLRVAVEALVRKFNFVDYFPSYEIATSYGAQGFEPDNVHIKDGVVDRIVRYMLSKYAPSAIDLTEKILDSQSDLDMHRNFWHAIYSNQIDQAKNVSDRLIRVHPKSWLAHDAQGHFHSTNGDHALALESAKKSMELAGRSAGHLLRIGNIYDSLGDFSAARAYFVEAAMLPDGDEAQKRLIEINSRAETVNAQKT